MSHSTMWTDDVDADPDSDLSSSECNVDYRTDREQVHVYHHYTPQIQIQQDHHYPQTQSRTFLAAPRSAIPTLSRSHSIGHAHTTDHHAASPQPIPNFSHRLSRIPYHHHDVPELLTSRDDLSVTASPSTPTPITPTCNGFHFDDIFHPLSTPYRSRLGSTTSSCGQRTPSLRPVSNMSTRLPDPDAVSFTNSPNLATTDTVSSLSSFETPKPHQPGGRAHMRSISIGGPMLKMDGSPGKQSLSSTTSGSSEERNRNAKNASRRMGGLLARIWPGASSSASNERRNMPADHKRSLTPHKLERPKMENGVPIVPGAQPFEPSSLSSYTSRSEYGPPSTSHSLDVQRRGSSAENMKDGSGGGGGGGGAAFGVDLKESIKIAPSKIRISHRGKSTSYRLFPLSVYKCCEFIRNSGCTDPSLFASTGNSHNVAHLKDIFNTAPTYGDDFDFINSIGPEGDPYTPYDAARLILIYLRELPKPLVSQSVLRSWIMLARQEGAIEPAAPKLEDMGFDFWTEALNRLPLHNRNLVKHLLDLFAEMLLRSRATANMLAEAQARTQTQSQSQAQAQAQAQAQTQPQPQTQAQSKGKSPLSPQQQTQAAVVHEVDARRLASALSRSMFHTDDMNLPKKTAAHPTLALAFLIKKRGDYARVMGKVVTSTGSGTGSGMTRKERRRESELFLPSTREIMEWKGGRSYS
ncbi:putative RhoGAP group protein [Sordaria brevicollis]|uniref:RhoGAP group protein n=1 Tax=Sordaria brevicollis TaxID=83679 RepID=A0AAE0UCX8_SORBR|nr:putative RhoGAP group protein [Sordaria brevicollis]